MAGSHCQKSTVTGGIGFVGVFAYMGKRRRAFAWANSLRIQGA
jgi:hypothetical protein